MDANSLTQDEKEILKTIAIHRAMLGECRGSNPSFLKPGQPLWAWFGYPSQQACRDSLSEYLTEVTDKYPNLQEYLDPKQWQVIWDKEKFYVKYGTSFNLMTPMKLNRFKTWYFIFGMMLAFTLFVAIKTGTDHHWQRVLGAVIWMTALCLLHGLVLFIRRMRDNKSNGNTQ